MRPEPTPVLSQRVGELGMILRLIVTGESRFDGGLEPAQGFSLAEQR
jgi:hypothetical protein